MRYDRTDDATYFLDLGATCRYLIDPLPGGYTLAGYLAAGYAAPEFDDSGWSQGAQPFVASDIGDPGSLFLPRPFGETPPPWSYTTITPGTRVAVRIHFTVPVLVAHNMTDPTFARLGMWHSGTSINAYLDGTAFGTAETGEAFDLMLGSFADGETLASPGAHVLAFVGDNAVGATLLWFGNLLTRPRLRQFPRDDALGGAPRQTRDSRSVQSSARQGWAGSYR